MRKSKVNLKITKLASRRLFKITKDLWTRFLCISSPLFFSHWRILLIHSSKTHQTRELEKKSERICSIFIEASDNVSKNGFEGGRKEALYSAVHGVSSLSDISASVLPVCPEAPPEDLVHDQEVHTEGNMVPPLPLCPFSLFPPLLFPLLFPIFGFL